MPKAKSFKISKLAVWYAFQRIKKNGGSYGVDQISIEKFEENLKDNLYKIWNRMSSGSYFPPPVRAVSIPKKNGGVRTLGIPTVADRIAQQVVRDYLEPIVDPIFHEDSYGYRPGKSAHQAIAVTKKRCWKYKWVLEFDIQGLFDNIDHNLLSKALHHHCKDKWIILHVERWLKAPLQLSDGSIVPRVKGTPQGGVVSPLLANIFLHYAFDSWLTRNFRWVPFCRYADDGLLHFKTEHSAIKVKDALERRLADCGLKMHPGKTKIVFCGTSKTEDQRPREFDFLGFTFRRRLAISKDRKIFTGFLPAISKSALKEARKIVRLWKIQLRTNCSLQDLSNWINPTLRGWFNYYGKEYASALYPLWDSLNQFLVRWVRYKFKKFHRHRRRAVRWL